MDMFFRIGRICSVVLPILAYLGAWVYAIKDNIEFGASIFLDTWIELHIYVGAALMLIWFIVSWYH